MKYLISTCLLLLVSCSSTEEKTPEVKTYSDETNQAFEMIEKGGGYKTKKPPPPLAAPQVKKTKKSAKADGRLVEINQNLAFYCMKHRKDPRFGGDESRCMSFVNRALADCQTLHRIVNSDLLNCIQKKLKKRR